MQEDFERLGFHQRAQQSHLDLARRRVFIGARLEPMPHPVTDAGVLNVHELGANRVGINLLQPRDHLAQRHLFVVEEEF